MTELIKNNISFLRRRGISINLASKVLLKNNRLTLEDLKGDTKYQTSYSLIDEKNSGLFKKVMGFCESFVGTGPIGANKFWEYPWVLINMKLEKGLKVLDAGCGKSPIQFALAKLGCETYGIDPFESVSWHGIDRKLPSLYGVKVAYKVEGMEKISYPDNYFDRVCSVSVIEHCRTKEPDNERMTPQTAEDKALQKTMVKEMLRVLKPGGLLVLTTDYNFPRSSSLESSNIDIKNLLEVEGCELVGAKTEHALPGYEDFDSAKLVNDGNLDISNYMDVLQTSIGFVLKKN